MILVRVIEDFAPPKDCIFLGNKAQSRFHHQFNAIAVPLSIVSNHIFSNRKQPLLRFFPMSLPTILLLRHETACLRPYPLVALLAPQCRDV